MRRLSLSRRLASGPAVRRHALRVAFVATLLVAAGYVAACLTIDLVTTARFRHDLDQRLAERLEALTRTVPTHNVGLPGAWSHPPSTHPDGSEGDLDDAPVLAWWVPAGSALAVPLDSGTPALPPAQQGVRGTVQASFGGRSFRLLGAAAPGGRVVVATSATQISSTANNVLINVPSLAAESGAPSTGLSRGSRSVR